MKFRFRHFSELDGFRGVASLPVVGGHVLDRTYGIPNDVGELGGVLFFVLSGFLIRGLLQREARADWNDLPPGVLPEGRAAHRSGTDRVRGAAVSPDPLRRRHRHAVYSVAAVLLFVRNIWGKGAASGHLWSLSARRAVLCRPALGRGACRLQEGAGASSRTLLCAGESSRPSR